MTADLTKFEHPDDPRPIDPTEIGQRNADIAAGRLVSVARGDLLTAFATSVGFVRHCIEAGHAVPDVNALTEEPARIAREAAREREDAVNTAKALRAEAERMAERAALAEARVKALLGEAPAEPLARPASSGGPFTSITAPGRLV